MSSRKLIHICGGGGVAGIGLTRCLKGHFVLQGHDQSTWAEKMMECDKEGVHAHDADLIIPVPDKAVLKYAEKGGGLGSGILFLPSYEEVKLCQDKAKTAEVLGNLAPKTFWVRDTQGAGGKGAQMCSEYLPGRNYSCELVYRAGELLGHFTKERLSYRVGSVDPLVNGIGSSAVSRCISSSRIVDIAKDAVERVSKHCDTVPNGVYSADFKENEDGQPKVTEINAGRFLTASYVYFYSTGYNLPLLMVKKFFTEPYEIGAYPEGVGVIRQTDSMPYVGAI